MNSSKNMQRLSHHNPPPKTDGNSRLQMKSLIVLSVIGCLIIQVAYFSRLNIDVFQTITATLGWDTLASSTFAFQVGNDTVYFEEKDISSTTSVWSLSLDELVSTGGKNASECTSMGLTLIDDVIGPSNVWDRKIPKVVHVTGFTRCLTKPFQDNLEKWKLMDHSFYFHDEEAIDRLLQKTFWPEFPQLKIFQNCMISGAAKADLWRYLVLYRYGGIYTDMDSAPNTNFFVPGSNETIISDDDDSFFVVERLGVISQWFMAASPRHPLMYLSVMHVFSRLLEPKTIGEQYVPFVTGPGALKNAFISFLKGNTTGYPTAGRYIGHHNRSVTVVGNKRNENEFVKRESVRGPHKRQGYAQMKMKHFSNKGSHRDDEERLKSPCLLHMYTVAQSNSSWNM